MTTLLLPLLLLLLLLLLLVSYEIVNHLKVYLKVESVS